MRGTNEQERPLSYRPVLPLAASKLLASRNRRTTNAQRQSSRCKITRDDTRKIMLRNFITLYLISISTERIP